MKQSCAILVPVAHHIEPQCEMGLRELERQGYQVRRAYGQAAIDLARSQLASEALADGFEELMWIDSDIGFDPADVAKLRERKEPLLFGVYPKKKRIGFACTFLPDTKQIRFGAGAELTELLHCGFGFVHSRREVYEAIQKHYHLPVCNKRFGNGLVPYFMPMILPDPAGGWYLAEDFAFCERARRSGFKILADTSIRLWHIGAHMFGWEEGGEDQPRHAQYVVNLERKPRTANPAKPNSK